LIRRPIRGRRGGPPEQEFKPPAKAGANEAIAGI
jgi:hypothetical protein